MLDIGKHYENPVGAMDLLLAGPATLVSHCIHGGHANVLEVKRVFTEGKGNGRHPIYGDGDPRSYPTSMAIRIPNTMASGPRRPDDLLEQPSLPSGGPPPAPVAPRPAPRVPPFVVRPNCLSCICLRSAVGCKPREAVLYPDSVHSCMYLFVAGWPFSVIWRGTGTGFGLR